jgi:hypothetical protein
MPASIGRPDFNEYWVSSPSFHNRGNARVDLFLLHTQEGPGNADSLARYLANPNNQVSYHYTVSQDPRDGGVTVCDVVDTDFSSWSVLSANNRAINLCFAGSSANWSTDQWMAQSRAIDVAAYIAVSDCLKYGIPIKVLAPPYSSGPPGISDHKYVTQFLGDGTHNDVGGQFPWPFFQQCVAKYAAAAVSQNPKPLVTPAPAPVAPTPAPFRFPSSDEMIRQIWEQLFGPRAAGWTQLGGKTLVDAVADIQKRLQK